MTVRRKIEKQIMKRIKGQVKLVKRMAEWKENLTELEKELFAGELKELLMHRKYYDEMEPTEDFWNKYRAFIDETVVQGEKNTKKLQDAKENKPTFVRG